MNENQIMSKAELSTLLHSLGVAVDEGKTSEKNKNKDLLHPNKVLRGIFHFFFFILSLQEPMYYQEKKKNHHQ